MNSFKKIYHSLDNKRYIVSLIIIVLIFGLVFFTVRMSKVELQGKSLKISGVYSMNIDINDIKEVSLQDSLPQNLTRTNGVDFFGRQYIGKYSSKDLGKMRLYVYANQEPYLYITLNNGDYKHVIIAYKDKKQTKDLYEKIINIKDKTK